MAIDWRARQGARARHKHFATDIIDPETTASAALGAVRSASITLTDAQIKALPTTPVEVVPAKAGFILLPLMAVLENNNIAAYTNVNATFSFLSIVYGNDAVEPMTILTQSDGQGGVREANVNLGSFLGTDPLRVILTTYGGGIVSAPQNMTIVASTYPAADFESALNIYAYNMGSGNFTGGNAANTMKITLVYTEVAP